jgi:hypothetical protein
MAALSLYLINKRYQFTTDDHASQGYRILSTTEQNNPIVEEETISQNDEEMQ